MRDTSLDEFIGEDDADGDRDDGTGDDGTGDEAAETVGSDEGDGVAGADSDAVAEEGTGTDGGGEESAGGNELEEGAAAADDVQPAVPTSEWTPDGATCAECDVVVERRWRDGGALVCTDCKDW